MELYSYVTMASIFFKQEFNNCVVILAVCYIYLFYCTDTGLGIRSIAAYNDHEQYRNVHTTYFRKSFIFYGNAG